MMAQKICRVGSKKGALNGSVHSAPSAMAAGTYILLFVCRVMSGTCPMTSKLFRRILGQLGPGVLTSSVICLSQRHASRRKRRRLTSHVVIIQLVSVRIQVLLHARHERVRDILLAKKLFAILEPRLRRE